MITVKFVCPSFTQRATKSAMAVFLASAFLALSALSSAVEEAACTLATGECFLSQFAQEVPDEIDLGTATFSRLSDDQRQEIYSKIASGLSPREALVEITSQRVPYGLHEQLIDEARSNGADEDLEIPGFEALLTDIQQTGDGNLDTLLALIEVAPNHVLDIPSVRSFWETRKRLQQSEADLQQAKENRQKSEEDLRQSEEYRLMAEEYRLKAEEVLEALTKLEAALQGQ